jgi:hypothetical protein
VRLALFVVPRLCQARFAASRLGGRCRRSQDGFRRAEGLTPDFARLHPGYLLKDADLNVEQENAWLLAEKIAEDNG